MSLLPDRPFTDEDLTALEALLDSPVFHGEAMALDELQAFFCAIVSGPAVIPASVWMPVALGEKPEYESVEQAQASMELVMRLHNDVARTLMAGQPVAPIVYGESEEDQAESWAALAGAYLDGMDLSEPYWFDATDDEDEADYLDEMLMPCLILSGVAEEEARRAGAPWPEGAELAQLLVAAREELPHAILALHRFWLAKRTPDPVRRGQPKVGRNDPCPCGSGRKFKLCCGKDPVLH